MSETGKPEGRREAALRRLRTDYVYWCDKAAWIVNKRAKRVRLVLKRPQKRLLRGLMAQRAAGNPMRAIVLKARQIGMSTVVEVVMACRVTQEENHLGLVLAQDRKTAGKLFKMAEFVHANLPAQIKPPVARRADTEDRKYLVFGEPSQSLRRQGVLGLNSTLEISTAAGLAGRGLTPRTLHVSEYAWWEQTEALLGVLNGVPDDEDTLVVKESTAKGHNHFKDEWDLAVSGESGEIAFFSPWFEEEDYRRPFANDSDAMELEQGLELHPRYGEGERKLYELILSSYHEWHAEEPYPWLTAAVASSRDPLGGAAAFRAALHRRVLEHLAWRRWAIAAKCQGKVDRFKQEYPSTPDEAFLATGARVFDANIVAAVLKRCEGTDPAVPTIEKPGPIPGVLRIGESKPGKDRAKQPIVIPTSALWVPASKREHDEVARWRLWEAPQKEDREQDRPAGQYIAFMDPASGETDEKGTTHAEHAITVIDHRTRLQVAEWYGQVDPDLAALELLLVALYFNRAWVNVERTGGYGLSILRKLAIDWKYPYVWTEESKDKRATPRSDRLGWSTDSVSKPLMEAELTELLRLEKDGIRSRKVASQMLTFVRDDRGRTAPEAGHLSDGLMSYMGAQMTAKLRPIRPDFRAQSKPKPKRGRRSKRTGY